jgi:anti-anti-sigma factor
MPLEKWSDKVNVLHLADEPQFTDDFAAMDEHLAQIPVDVVLDFSSVHFINSSNISRLLKLRKQMITRDRRLVICAVSTQVWGAFVVTGLDKIFEFSPTVPSALSTLQSK